MLAIQNVVMLYRTLFRGTFGVPLSSGKSSNTY
jgi:hypothetical protein